MEKQQSKYIRQNAPGMRDVTLIELLFDGMIIVNLAIMLSYPVYAAINDYFHRYIFAFVVLMIVAGTKFEFSLMRIIGLVVFLGLGLLILKLNHSSLGAVFQFVWPLSIIYAIKNLDLSEYYAERINIIMSVAWVLAIFEAYRNTSTYFYETDLGNHAGMINPNTTAIVIAGTCLFIGFYAEKITDSVWIKLFIYAVSLVGIHLTKSRGSLLALAVVIVVEFVFRNAIIRSRRFAVTLLTLAIFGGIAFPFIYIALYNTGILTLSTTFLGKRVFTGRQYIWNNVVEYMLANKQALLIGTGYNEELYYAGTFNLHNGYIQLFAQFGLPVLLVYMIYLICVVSGMFGEKKYLTHHQFMCYQIILLTVCIGYGETIFSYIQCMLFYVIALGIGCRETNGGGRLT